MIKFGYLGSDGSVYRLPSQGDVVSYMDEEFVVDSVDGDVASLINEDSESDVALVSLAEEVEVQSTDKIGAFVGEMVVIGEVNEGVLAADGEDNVYLVEETLDERVSKDSYPREGFVYRRKKNDQPVYVVAVYPDEEKVSFWDDEARRLSWDIDKFKKEMKPGKEEDYDIFESLDEEVLDEETEVLKTYAKGKKFYVDAKLKSGNVTYVFESKNGKTGEEIKKSFDGQLKHAPGRAWQYLKKNCVQVGKQVK